MFNHLIISIENKFAMKLLQAVPRVKSVASMPISSTDNFNVLSDYVLLVKGVGPVLLSLLLLSKR